MPDEPSISKSPYAGLAVTIRPQGSSDACAIAAERAAHPPLVRIALTRGAALLRLFTEPCRVLIDGIPIGQLSSREKVEATLVAGTHSIQVRCGWLRSNVSQFSVENGDIAQFVCTGHNSALDLLFATALFYAAVLPHHFFHLRSFRP